MSVAGVASIAGWASGVPAAITETPPRPAAMPVQPDVGAAPGIERQARVEPGGHLRLGVTLPADTKGQRVAFVVTDSGWTRPLQALALRCT